MTVYFLKIYLDEVLELLRDRRRMATLSELTDLKKQVLDLQERLNDLKTEQEDVLSEHSSLEDSVDTVIEAVEELLKQVKEEMSPRQRKSKNPDAYDESESEDD